MGGEKQSPCGGFAWNVQNQLFTYSYFLILIQLSNADLDASLCVYPHPPTDSTCKPENPSYKFWSVFLSRTALFCCSLCSEYG